MFIDRWAYSHNKYMGKYKRNGPNAQMAAKKYSFVFVLIRPTSTDKRQKTKEMLLSNEASWSD